MLGLFRKKITFELKPPEPSELMVVTHDIGPGGNPLVREVWRLIHNAVTVGVNPHSIAEFLYAIADDLVTGDYGKDQFNNERRDK